MSNISHRKDIVISFSIIYLIFFLIKITILLYCFNPCHLMNNKKINNKNFALLNFCYNVQKVVVHHQMMFMLVNKTNIIKYR